PREHRAPRAHRRPDPARAGGGDPHRGARPARRHGDAHRRRGLARPVARQGVLHRAGTGSGRPRGRRGPFARGRVPALAARPSPVHAFGPGAAFRARRVGRARRAPFAPHRRGGEARAGREAPRPEAAIALARERRAGPDGVLLLDKPAGITSTRAMAKAKRALGSLKAGHTGTLDPFATGLLPIVFGEATKFSRFLID